MEPIRSFLTEPREEPFFLWFAPTLPHTPFDAALEFRARYDGERLSPGALDYYANISRLDHAVGELMEAIEAGGHGDNTLVVFLADNGWDQATDARYPRGMDGSRGKGTGYELGQRTPVVFHAPNLVPRGERRDAMISTVDLLPTLLSYAGIDQTFQRPGRNLRTAIEHGSPGHKALHGRFVLHRRIGPKPGQGPGEGWVELVRTEDRRLVHFVSTGRTELYDIATDPREKRPLDEPARERELRASLLAWKRMTPRIHNERKGASARGTPRREALNGLPPH
jgi:uncharacterized sulfatase